MLIAIIQVLGFLEILFPGLNSFRMIEALWIGGAFVIVLKSTGWIHSYRDVGVWLGILAGGLIAMVVSPFIPNWRWSGFGAVIGGSPLIWPCCTYFVARSRGRVDRLGTLVWIATMIAALLVAFLGPDVRQ